MLDILSTLLTILPHDLVTSISSRVRGQGYAQMAAGLLLVPILTLCWRRLIPWIKWKLDDVLFPTAYIGSHDEAAEWIMTWIAQDPQAQKQMHHFWLSASDKQATKRSRNTLTSRPEKVDPKNASWATTRIVGKISPLHGRTIYINHNGARLWIKRSKMSHLKIRTYIFQRDALKEFLVAAHDAMHAHEDHTIHIFNPQSASAPQGRPPLKPLRSSISGWSGPLPRPSRPWSSVILPGTLKDDLLNDVEKFFSEKEVRWYSSRGIPHRRGYLFHGAPGAGKTTLTTALASRLQLDIYAINPGQSGMDDARLNKLFRVVPRRSIILIEDIDCIFVRQPIRLTQPTKPLVVDGEAEEGEGEESEEEESKDHARLVKANKKRKTPPPKQDDPEPVVGSAVSLSGLLNAIDGVSSQEGCILIASTNHIEHLDPALYRPGRFDVKIPFQSATPDQARYLFQHFFPLEDLLQAASLLSSTTPAPNGVDEKSQDPYNPFQVARPIPTTAVTSQKELDDLADRFVDAIFPRGHQAGTHQHPGPKLSMAALQGYLLRYKDDPTTAVEYAAEWTKSESMEEWQKQASSLITIQNDGLDPNGRKSKRKRKCDLGEPVSKKSERAAEAGNGPPEDSAASGKSKVTGGGQGEANGDH